MTPELMPTVSFSSGFDGAVCKVEGKPVGPNDFGVDDALFSEWLRYRGMPRCCDFTKSGRRCENMVKPSIPTCSPVDFDRRHRAEFCHLHQEKGAFRQLIDGGCVLLTPRKWRNARAALEQC